MTTSRNDMLIVTTESVPGREVAEVLGLVRGSAVRAKHIGSDIVAALRSVVGGEVKEYTQLLAGTREQAIDRMGAEAARMGANAVLAARMQTSAIQHGASEVVFYGTAVRLK